MKLTSHRLAYRPWSINSALLYIIAGVILLIGMLTWAKLKEQSLQSIALLIVVGCSIIVYGVIFCLKNSEVIIFDADKKQINKKYIIFPEREICSFDEVYSLSQESEGRVFCYVLIKKSQRGGNIIKISDDFFN